IQRVNGFRGRIKMAVFTAISSSRLDGLTPSFKNVYELWKCGYDSRSMHSKTAFYRYRTGLMDALGFDIATVQYMQHDNVVPFIRIIEAKPMGVPDWAIGPVLYFDGAVIHG
ncbi:phage/plasmid replication protein, II/X family, partial [Klebsiella pneumoniae subsp. pneumoniae]|uniref:phage/plasmid replication protein, II/X family n=1 Tax=Klebsiella pneumoniae TaxID=573 RepID=UPI003CED7B00